MISAITNVLVTICVRLVVLVGFITVVQIVNDQKIKRQLDSVVISALKKLKSSSRNV